MPPHSRILTLREQLAELDASLLELVAHRQSMVSEIGRLKAESGRPTRDYAQEKEVISRARKAASALNLDGDLAEELLLLLIRASLTVQERERVRASAEGGGRRVLVIGGSGKMGQWLARFLASQGFQIEVADPLPPAGDFPHRTDWRTSELDHDIIVVAAPLGISRQVLEELARRKPGGLVFDIGSLKTPLRPALLACARAGLEITSIHPMFGPDTELLSGRNVIFVDVGVPEATRRAKELFASTMAVQVEMDLESHDRVVAYILGLSHALNIAFFTALAESGEQAQRLAQLSSTTFDAQLEVARRVASENPHLYYEIQRLNEFREEALNALLHAVERVHGAVRSGDEAEFAALMVQGEKYLSGVPRRQSA